MSVFSMLVVDEVKVSNVSRTSRGDIELDVEIVYDALWQTTRYRHCRGNGLEWEYFLADRNEWKEAPEWLIAEINADLVYQRIYHDSVVPLLKKTG